VFVDHRRDLDRLPSTVESNWKSIDHITFGASSPDRPSAHRIIDFADPLVAAFTSYRRAVFPSIQADGIAYSDPSVSNTHFVGTA
jgi:hypothetical protein